MNRLQIILAGLTLVTALVLGTGCTSTAETDGPNTNDQANQLPSISDDLDNNQSSGGDGGPDPFRRKQLKRYNSMLYALYDIVETTGVQNGLWEDESYQDLLDTIEAAFKAGQNPDNYADITRNMTFDEISMMFNPRAEFRNCEGGVKKFLEIIGWQGGTAIFTEGLSKDDATNHRGATYNLGRAGSVWDAIGQTALNHSLIRNTGFTLKPALVNE